MPEVDETIIFEVELSIRIAQLCRRNFASNRPADMILFPAQPRDVDDEGLLLKLCQMVEPVWSVVWRGVLPST